MNNLYCTCEDPMLWHDGRDLCCERCDKALSPRAQEDDWQHAQAEAADLSWKERE